jgi:hypothetical protein
MRKKVKTQETPPELVIAIGLVWGHLNARQFEEAHALAKGCLRIWPDDRSLALMAAYAAAELLEPVDVRTLAGLRDATNENWIQLVLRRAEKQTGQPEQAAHA